MTLRGNVMISLRMPHDLRDRCRQVRTLGGRSRSLSDVCRCAWGKARKLDRADRRVVIRDFRQATTREGSEANRVQLPDHLADWASQHTHPELCAFVAWAIDGLEIVPPVPKELQVTHD